MRVGEVGEFGLIDKLATIVPELPENVLLGIGDDAAAWRSMLGTEIATTDTMVENVHFRLDFATWYDLGWKCIAMNLSDIAAMGGIARYALVTVGVARNVGVEAVAEMYRGMADIARRFGTSIVGGDTVSSPLGVLVSATVFGEAIDDAQPPRLMLRSGAQVGDQICVTGTLGSSAAGLDLFVRGVDVDPKAAAILRQAHLRPVPRLREGNELVKLGVRAGMDISDGLVGDLQKLCQRSGVGARIFPHLLPIAQAARDCFPANHLDLALYGGEDYELLFCAPSETVGAARQVFAAGDLAPITVLGEIVGDHVGQVVLLGPDGIERQATKGGWDHFIDATRG